MGAYERGNGLRDTYLPEQNITSGKTSVVCPWAVIESEATIRMSNSKNKFPIQYSIQINTEGLDPREGFSQLPNHLGG